MTLRDELYLMLLLAPVMFVTALAHGPDIALLLDDSRVAIAGDTPSADYMPNIQLKPEN